MRIRIIKKNFKGRSEYAIQGKFPFFPIWFILTEENGLFGYKHIYVEHSNAIAAYKKIIAERDVRPECAEIEVINES